MTAELDPGTRRAMDAVSDEDVRRAHAEADFELLIGAEPSVNGPATDPPPQPSDSPQPLRTNEVSEQCPPFVRTYGLCSFVRKHRRSTMTRHTANALAT